MSTTCASEMMEFRCTHCWHSNVVETQLAGSEVECQSCGHALSVPDASPDRIARAEALLKEMEQLDTPPPARPKAQEVVSDKELIALAQKRCKFRWRRWTSRAIQPLRYWLDWELPSLTILLFMISAILGVGLLVAMVHLGLAGNPADQVNRDGQFPIVPLIYFGTIPFTLLCIQWVLLSTCGQTIGKEGGAHSHCNGERKAAWIPAGCVSSQLGAEIIGSYPFSSPSSTSCLVWESRIDAFTTGLQ